MGIHFRKQIKWYQVVAVLVVALLMVLLMHGFEWAAGLRAYGLLLAVTAALAVVALGTLYVIGRVANVSGLKEGTTVTADRESALKEYSHKG